MDERTRRRRVRGLIAPTGTSTNAGATRLPTSPCSALERTDTGTITRSVRPLVGSPRASRSSCSPPATALSTTSLTVPPSTFLTSRSRSNGVSAIANRRAGPISVSKGPAGGEPMPITSRTPAQRLGDIGEGPLGRAHRLPDRFERVQHHVLHGVANQVLAAGRVLGDPRGLRRGAQAGVGRQVEQRRGDQHARDAVGERMVHLQQHGRALVREALEHVELPQRLGRVERT